MTKRGFGGDNWCLAGDFNAITVRSERKGITAQLGSREMAEFNHFIAEMNIIDIPALEKNSLGLVSMGPL